MSQLEMGDLVVLTAGSMRMAVESVAGDEVACVWCHEGQIGRDTFNAALLKKWEVREDDRAPRGKPYGGDRDGGGKRLRIAAVTANLTTSPKANRAGMASRAKRNTSARTDSFLAD